MSTGRPPAAEVASTRTSAPSVPSGRATGAITPVEVSLCAHAYASMPASARAAGALPGSARSTEGSPRNGAPAVTSANFEENSPNTRCCARSRTSPNAAASQNAVAPPLPSTTAYPSGSENSAASPDRTRPTRSFTGACRCEVPSTAAPGPASEASASGRTLDGPQPNRPSRGLRSSGSEIWGAVTPPWCVSRPGS